MSVSVRLTILLAFASFLQQSAIAQGCVVNGTVVVTCESGDDIGAKITKAITDLGSTGGIVLIPSGTYTSTTTINISTPNISIVGNGSAATQINYEGTGDFIRIQMNPFTVVQAGRFAGLTVNVGASAISAIHIGDAAGVQLEDLVLNGPTTSGGSQAGVWFDNETAWTERTELLRVHANYFEKDYRFTTSGNSSNNSSFGYTRFLDSRANIGPGQTMISFEGGYLYNSLIVLLGNSAGGSGSNVISLSGKTWSGGSGAAWQDNMYVIQTEQTSGSGTTLFNIATGTTLAGAGYIKGDNMSYGTVAGAVLPTQAYFGLGGSAIAPSFISYFNALDNFWEGLSLNLNWNGSTFVTQGDTVHNGGAAIMNQGTAGNLGVFVVPSIGGTNQTISQSNISNYQVATFGSSSIALNRATTINGSLSVTGAKNFKIDDPVDPEGKYLYHTSVESPDMLDLYEGNVVTNSKGYSTIVLPDYFEALNGDFRYQLTPVGRLCQVAVVHEIKNNRFTIRTSVPRTKVSWQVAGIRHDAYARAYRSPVEEYKRAGERGKYLYPELYKEKRSVAIVRPNSVQ